MGNMTHIDRVYHITRGYRNTSPGEPMDALCTLAVGQSVPVSLFYKYKRIPDWCPECVAGLTPLDDLAHTEL